MNWKDKVIKARISLLTMQPFFGTLAMRLHITEMSKDMEQGLFVRRGLKPTMAVDGRSIFVSPSFIDGLSGQLLRSAIAHEVSHCAFEHTGRRGARNPSKWNAACDYAINLTLKDSGFEIDGNWLCSEQYRDMSSEQIYNMLPDDDGDGDGEGGGGGSLCYVMDGPGDSADMDPALQEEWTTAVAQAAFAAQQAGKLPANLERMVKDRLNPKTDWRTVLRRFVTQISKNDYSWSRPNKKMLGGHGVYLPSLYSESMGKIVIAVDTSGSITDKMLAIFESECQSVVSSVMPEAKIVIYCDAQINHVDKFTQHEVLEMKMHGGGGTDFRPPFDWVETEGERPACMLYFTDGYGPFPETPPGYPTLWCMTTKVEPPWGEVVEVDLAGELA